MHVENNRETQVFGNVEIKKKFFWHFQFEFISKLSYERQNFLLKYIKECLTNTMNSLNELDYILEMRYFYSLNSRTPETTTKDYGG